MISYLFSYQPKSNNKADNNSPSEPTASKYVTPVGKLDGTYSPTSDVYKESSSN